MVSSVNQWRFSFGPHRVKNSLVPKNPRKVLFYYYFSWFWTLAFRSLLIKVYLEHPYLWSCTSCRSTFYWTNGPDGSSTLLELMKKGEEKHQDGFFLNGGQILSLLLHWGWLGCLGLLALLPKEDWKLWMVSWRICRSRPWWQPTDVTMIFYLKIWNLAQLFGRVCTFQCPKVTNSL